MNKSSRASPLLLLGATLALGACATAAEAPLDAFQAADIAIANADKDHAGEFAPLEMRTAHEKIAVARTTAQEPDEQRVAQARRLADEARADADLASAKTRLAKADAVNRELQKSNSILQQETQRGSGA